MNAFAKIATGFGVVAALYWYARSSEVTSGLAIQDSFIAHQKLAIVEWDQHETRLYFGDLNGTDFLAVNSAFDLGNPFIDQNGRLLFAERRGFEENTVFRLLEVEVRQGHPVCRVLHQSNDAIQSPIVYVGSDPETILFFSGLFNPQAIGGSVSILYLHALTGGQERRVLNEKFSSLNSMVQISDNSFFAVSPFYRFSGEPAFVQVYFRSEWNAVATVISSIKVPGRANSASYNPYSHVIYIQSSEFSPDLSVMTTMVDPATMKTIRTVELPRGWNYSDAFVEDNDLSGDKVFLLATPLEQDNEPRSIALLALEAEGVRELRTFSLKAARELSTDECSAASSSP